MRPQITHEEMENWKSQNAISNKGFMGNKVKFEEQLKSMISENLEKVKING